MDRTKWHIRDICPDMPPDMCLRTRFRASKMPQTVEPDGPASALDRRPRADQTPAGARTACSVKRRGSPRENFLRLRYGRPLGIRLVKRSSFRAPLRARRPSGGLMAISLRANDDETITPREFTLEG